MGNVLSFALTLYLYSLIFSLFLALVRFLKDVKKWHDKEEKVHITKSAFEADLNEPVQAAEASEPVENPVGEEVENIDTEHTECHSPIVF